MNNKFSCLCESSDDENIIETNKYYKVHKIKKRKINPESPEILSYHGTFNNCEKFIVSYKFNSIFLWIFKNMGSSTITKMIVLSKSEIYNILPSFNFQNITTENIVKLLESIIE